MDDVSQPGDSSERLAQLVLAHLDERLSDDEFAELQQRLESDPAARAEYVKLARLDAELRDDLETTEGEADKVISLPIEEARLSPAARNLAIAAALALMALPAAMLLRPGGEDRREPDAGLLTSGGASGDSAAATRGVAVITAQADAVWGADGDGDGDRGRVLGEGVALEPGRLTLREGLAQIDFYGGASISLSGPAEIELIGPDSAVLHRGRVRADVPPAARGFEIRTGEVLIEDLGTSFGLAVGDDDEADVVVFDGEVRAIGSDGKPLSLFGGDAAHLKNGEAALQDAAAAGAFPGIADVIAGAGDRDESRFLAWQQASLKRRKDPRLVAYYDFEELTAVSRRLENRAMIGLGSELDGGIVGARVAEGRWGQKTALDFRLEGDRVRFQIPGEFEALTLYAWVRIDALDRNLNSLFLTDYFDPNEIHWQISREGMMHFATSPMGVEDLTKHNRRFYSDSFWNPGMSGQWFLLATTVDRTRGGSPVTHFINGKAIGFSGGTHMDQPLPKMRIGGADLGNWSEPIWPTAIRTLNGRIDEFAIFSQALSAEEIQTIYEQGKP